MRHALRAVDPVFRFMLAIALIGGVALAFPLVRSAAARQRAAHVDATQSDREPDAVTGDIEAAWDRAGCQLNPGNPTCVLLGRAAACVVSDRDPACTSDSDNDGCRDISEVMAGLDPLNGDDCLGDAAGLPLLNCLFLHSNAPCHAESDRSTPLDCPLLSRDPTCDGFAR